VGVPITTLIPAACIASTTRSIQANWNSPSRGSQLVQVDSPTRTTLIPARFISSMSFSSRS
jgi:hypothetical protein